MTENAVTEVSQHLGNNTVRCIMLASSEGLCREVEVTATGFGDQGSCRRADTGTPFNVLGETTDNGGTPVKGRREMGHPQGSAVI